MSCFIGLFTRIINNYQHQYDRVYVEDERVGEYSCRKAPIPSSCFEIAERIGAINSMLKKHCEANGTAASVLSGANRDIRFVEALEKEKSYLRKVLLQSRAQKKEKPD